MKFFIPNAANIVCCIFLFNFYSNNKKEGHFSFNPKTSCLMTTKYVSESIEFNDKKNQFLAIVTEKK